MISHEEVITATRNWVERMVIDLNLCPFAKRELMTQRLHFSVSEAIDEQQLLLDLHNELERLDNNPDIETSLLVHPQILTDFYDYNQFLDLADNLLIQLELDGIYQIASFHPDYQFADTQVNDAENYSNKSPYPMLHLLREESLEQAIQQYGDTVGIPKNNTKLLKKMGANPLKKLLLSCFE